MDITIRLIEENDPERISNAFRDQGWQKPVELYLRYLKDQRNEERVALVAEADGNFAGYANIIWNSRYPSFRYRHIPEVNDFNVLIAYRRCGIGTALMDKAEEIIAKRSDTAGIGVGLLPDYGPAQIMYVKRGYIPDGKGVYKHPGYPEWGQNVIIDDDIALYLVKQLR